MGVKPFNVMDFGKASLLNPEQLGYKDSIDIIKDESIKIQKSFVKIGWYLKHIRDNELYKEDGYENIWECAADQLGYSQSTASRFINICEKFSKGHNSPELDAKYAGFDKSQMIEMLPMEQEQLDKINPDMTVKEIRDIKMKNKTPEPPEDMKTNDDIPGQTSIEKDFPEYLPGDEADDGQDKITPEVYATSHREKDLCPPSASSCIRQEWGTTPEQQEAGKKECEKCWEHYKKLSPTGSGDIQGEEGNVIDGEYRELEDSELTEEAVAVSDTEETAPEPESQPLLPIFKNNDQRKEWLADYKSWGLWYRDEHIDVNYYKCDFPEGSRLVVAEYPQRYGYWNDKRSDEHYYHLLEKNKKSYKKTYDEQYRNQTDSETYLVDFLKKLQKNGKGCL